MKLGALFPVAPFPLRPSLVGRGLQIPSSANAQISFPHSGTSPFLSGSLCGLLCVLGWESFGLPGRKCGVRAPPGLHLPLRSNSRIDFAGEGQHLLCPGRG